MDELTAKNIDTNQKSQTTSITTTVAISSQLDGVIDSNTQGMSRKALNTRLKMRPACKKALRSLYRLPEIL